MKSLYDHNFFCRDSNEPVMSWIDKNCADRLNSPAFIHLLTTSVVESCIDGVGEFIALVPNSLF